MRRIVLNITGCRCCFRYHSHIAGKARIRNVAVKEMIAMKESKLAELRDQLAQERTEYYAKKDEVRVISSVVPAMYLVFIRAVPFLNALPITCEY